MSISDGPSKTLLSENAARAQIADLAGVIAPPSWVLVMVFLGGIAIPVGGFATYDWPNAGIGDVLVVVILIALIAGSCIVLWTARRAIAFDSNGVEVRWLGGARDAHGWDGVFVAPSRWPGCAWLVRGQEPPLLLFTDQREAVNLINATLIWSLSQG